jgi:hypothetical protein
MQHRSYIADVNLFNLAGPPKWWLDHLWDFDDSLVVVPSRQGFYYRLAQRRKPNLADDICKEALFAESDTRLLASYGLVPVTTILATANWSNPLLFEELRRRSPHRMGGATACADRLDAADAADELAKRQAEDERLTSIGKDAWGLYNKKIGLRSHMWIPKTSGRKATA